MAVSLAESAKLATDHLNAGVIQTFIEESPILDRMPLESFEGNKYTYTEEAELPGISFRAVNEAYPESSGVVNELEEGLAILGGDVDVDRYIVQTRSKLNNQRAIRTYMKVKAASIDFSDNFFNGDRSVNPKGIEGLRRRLIGRQVIDANKVGPTSNQYDFFDALDALVAAVPKIGGSNGALYMNSALIGKVKSGYRRLGGGELLMREIHGKEAVVWNGIPLLDPGQKLNGADILPLTKGADGKETGEIYAVRFGNEETDAAVTGLTNGGIQATDLGEAHDKPVYRTRIEFYCGIAIFGGKGAARLTNVLNG
ncbi:major capsid protein [Streptomyces yaizuensis]|uniref:Major structural phage protein n=1 Tax=Streptomyces yaizuensis TaxID=2989713 RepID=A0ABQ5P9X8_9ACTN|nr:hypothetical protein [Streptomyces sp. YSPA8]GLF99367.1 Major structural phage protein [Streptomyces sp. YSPA8]